MMSIGAGEGWIVAEIERSAGRSIQGEVVARDRRAGTAA